MEAALHLAQLLRLSAALLPIGPEKTKCHVVFPALIALVTLIVLVGFLILIAQPLVFEHYATQKHPSYASQIGAMARNLAEL